MSNQTFLDKAEQAATDILKKELSPTLAFHDYDHTQRVVNGVHAIGMSSHLEQDDLRAVLIAAWFHETGYRDEYNGHEEKSIEIAQEFMGKEGVDNEFQKKVIASIKATEKGYEPKNLLEEVIIDAGHFAMIEGYCKDLQEKMRQEVSAIKKEEVSEQKGAEYYLEEILKFRFHTTFGQKVLLPARDKLRSKLEKRINKLSKALDESLLNNMGVSAAQLKVMKKKLLKAEGIPERGIETMFRLTSKNHLTLSGMADSKANIMITINSLIISIILGSLMNKLDSNPHLIYPTIILLTVTLGSLIFAILSLRPNVSDGRFTRDDIENQRTNLLFFGNFHKMKRADYHWGMNKLMENGSFLYSNLIDDIYFLGVVLAKKYNLLRTSYNIFMYGIVVAVIAFVISIFFAEEPVGEAIMNTLQNE